MINPLLMEAAAVAASLPPPIRELGIRPHVNVRDRRKYIDEAGRLMSWRICKGARYRHRPIGLPYPIERKICKGVTRHGRPCTQYTAVVQNDEDQYVSLDYCKHHLHTCEVTLFVNNTYADVIPDRLRRKVEAVLDSPQAQNLTEELALVKALLAAYLERQTVDDNVESLETMAIVTKVSGLISNLAANAANIAKQRENMIDVKQALIIVDACIAACMRELGKTVDRRELFLKILPELPWPQGVARVNGAEGIIGPRGALILPQPPKKTDVVTIEAGWSRLEERVVEPVAPASAHPELTDHFEKVPLTPFEINAHLESLKNEF